MATVFKVSEKEWQKRGLDPAGYKAILAKKHQIVWAPGGGWSIHNPAADVSYGKAVAKGKSFGFKVKPDPIFLAKYKELTGFDFVQGKPLLGDDVSSFPAPNKVSKAAPSIQQVPKSSQLPPSSVNLTTVDDVGVKLVGTSSVYISYLLSDDVNLAYRWTGNGLSIRAEKFTPQAKSALQDWGMAFKTGDRPYASCHLQITDKTLVKKTLGSLTASVLTGPPKKLLSAEKVV